MLWGNCRFGGFGNLQYLLREGNQMVKRGSSRYACELPTHLRRELARPLVFHFRLMDHLVHPLNQMSTAAVVVRNTKDVDGGLI